MQSESHAISRYALNGGVISRNCIFEFLDWIETRLAHVLLLFWVEVMRVIGSVELDVFHSLRNQPLHVVTNNFHEIIQQIRMCWIEFVSDARLVARQHKI